MFHQPKEGERVTTHIDTNTQDMLRRNENWKFFILQTNNFGEKDFATYQHNLNTKKGENFLFLHNQEEKNFTTKRKWRRKFYCIHGWKKGWGWSAPHTTQKQFYFCLKINSSHFAYHTLIWDEKKHTKLHMMHKYNFFTILKQTKFIFTVRKKIILKLTRKEKDKNIYIDSITAPNITVSHTFIVSRKY